MKRAAEFPSLWSPETPSLAFGRCYSMKKWSFKYCALRAPCRQERGKGNDRVRRIPIVGERRALDEANTLSHDLCNTQLLILKPTAHFQAICKPPNYHKLSSGKNKAIKWTFYSGYWLQCSVCIKSSETLFFVNWISNWCLLGREIHNASNSIYITHHN